MRIINLKSQARRFGGVSPVILLGLVSVFVHKKKIIYIVKMHILFNYNSILIHRLDQS